MTPKPKAWQVCYSRLHFVCCPISRSGNSKYNLDFLSLIRTLLLRSEGTLAREIPNMIWISTSLFVPLASPKVSRSGNSKYNLDFHSLIRTFGFAEGTLAREIPNMIWISSRLFVPLHQFSRQITEKLQIR